MLDYIVLGVVQGLTEFLPISSSGHLILARALLGFEQIDPAFNVFVQGGTVISVLIFFRKRLAKLTWKYLRLIIIASLPAAVIGIFLSNQIDTIFSSYWGVTLGFALTTIIISLSRYHQKQTTPLNQKNSLKIGLSQALAILPGLSRSGTTITASLLLGISSSEAFAFSFLLSIPTIAGASLLSTTSIIWESSLVPSYFVGFFTASLAGYLSLVLLAKLIKRGKFYLFAPYTAALTLLSLYLTVS